MKKIGFIGAGNMATAIIDGIIRSNSEAAANITVYDVLADKLDVMAKKGVNIAQCPKCTVKGSDIIVLAVKPQNYAEVLESIKPAVTADKVIVTIAAGISTDYIAKAIDCDCPMVRVMPNTPLLLGVGASAMSRRNISDEDFRCVYDMFANGGVVEILDETQMNSVIAVNGSSPAYVYLFAKAMVDYAEKEGIDPASALRLVCATLKGSAEMLENSGDTPDLLIKKVSSPGGTTLKALEKLEEKDFYNSIIEAMEACTKRADELSM
ncbi:MAG: pyrroline-5-carboxylate reductase [Lachnospiraceae bacterium]|nr:pyrroline-5-carboxylate reductase [Lachnospiraceae bacterium]